MQQLAKALAVFSVTGGLMSGAKALAASVKVGVSYDLCKTHTIGSPKISQAAMDPFILGGAREAVYLRRLPITPHSCNAGIDALEDFDAKDLMPPIAVAVGPPWHRPGAHRDMMQPSMGLANRLDCRTCRYRLKRGPGRSSQYG